MARARTSGAARKIGTANRGSEQQLWQTADALRNDMDAAKYRHVVLDLLSLKYNSDAFEARHAELLPELGCGGGAHGER